MPSGATGKGTFVFADIAGYTALTEAHGDADAVFFNDTVTTEIYTGATEDEEEGADAEQALILGI